MTETAFRIPTAEERAQRSIADEAATDPTNFATIAQTRTRARSALRSREAHPEAYTLTVEEAHRLAFAALAAWGVEDALTASGHTYRASYPYSTPYYERPNVKVGPYLSDAVRHVLRDRETTESDRHLVSALAAVGNVARRF